jgi:hypothetical protein
VGTHEVYVVGEDQFTHERATSVHDEVWYVLLS